MKRIILLLVFCSLLMGAMPAKGKAADKAASHVPAIPSGAFAETPVTFHKGKTYAVYSAPNTKSLRGTGKRARVSTNDWIQVLGADGDWLLVQYDIKGSRYRIGYITKGALPEGVTVPELTLNPAEAIVNYAVDVTDDPLLSQEKLTAVSENQRVTCLGIMGNWSYIEGETDGKLFRGFVPTSCLSGIVTNAEEARYALLGNWKLYAGTSLLADSITFYEGGSIIGRSADAYGTVTEWNGNWSISLYDTARDRYWNEPEFELCLTVNGVTRLLGLRICRRAAENGCSYALILADETHNVGTVLYND